jgi:hypothetical protein
LDCAILPRMSPQTNTSNSSLVWVEIPEFDIGTRERPDAVLCHTFNDGNGIIGLIEVQVTGKGYQLQ